MPFQAWIQNTCADPRCVTARFNGAMPFQAWIHCSGIGRRSQLVELQWGHALSGMDTTA